MKGLSVNTNTSKGGTRAVHHNLQQAPPSPPSPFPSSLPPFTTVRDVLVELGEDDESYFDETDTFEDVRHELKATGHNLVINILLYLFFFLCCSFNK